MAISIDSIDILQKYLAGVLHRADHHAGNVEGVALTLMGAVIWKSDGEIKVREYAGEPANIIWFSVSGRKYAMTYDHGNETILLRKNIKNGPVLHSFSNSSSYQDIIAAFKAL
jgi:hypothetical protein